jgi:carbamoyl-phosphate synthase large subunit
LPLKKPAYLARFWNLGKPGFTAPVFSTLWKNEALFFQGLEKRAGNFPSLGKPGRARSRSDLEFPAGRRHADGWRRPVADRITFVRNMNLLVTNCRTAQAYVIMQCLRPHAKKIVAEMFGRSWLAARISPAACSRLVDRVCRVPYPNYDWQSGRIQPENTEREEAYLQAILRICEREQIDTIFPSLDAHVYVFSKNQRRLRERGILVPVPEYEALLGSLDKYRTVQAAEACGFPHPRTILGNDEDAVQQFADEVKPPWVVRPRFTAGSAGLEFVTDRAALWPRVCATREEFGTPMVQEYIAGTCRQNFYLVVDRAGVVKSALAPRVLRYNQRIYRNGTAACESRTDHPAMEKAGDLARQIGWVGPITIQTKIDPRTGGVCLMEANPRVGTHLWYRTSVGINEPVMALRIARGEDVEAAAGITTGALLLDPLEDAVGLGFDMLDWMIYRVRTGLLGRAPLDTASPPSSPIQQARECGRYYLDRRQKLTNPLFRCWWNDPLVTLFWGYTLFRTRTRELTLLGR